VRGGGGGDDTDPAELVILVVNICNKNKSAISYDVCGQERKSRAIARKIVAARQVVFSLSSFQKDSKTKEKRTEN
jgi:hypothetical protein